MKKTLLGLLAAAALYLPLAAPAAILETGNVTGGGTFAGSVDSADAWVTGTVLDGTDAGFWRIDGQAGDRYSFRVTSTAIEFGLSLYQGLIDDLDLLVFGFDNAGPIGGTTFVAGTSPFGAAGTELLDIVFDATATYTLVVGGEGFEPFGEGPYAYSLEVTQVPEPATAALLLAGLVGTLARRRRTA